MTKITTRVAVAQFAYPPAALPDPHSCLSTPVSSFETGDILAGIPDTFAEREAALRDRLGAAWARQEVARSAGLRPRRPGASARRPGRSQAAIRARWSGCWP